MKAIVKYHCPIAKVAKTIPVIMKREAKLSIIWLLKIIPQRTKTKATIPETFPMMSKTSFKISRFGCIADILIMSKMFSMKLTPNLIMFF